jgi:hypothetical protein
MKAEIEAARIAAEEKAQHEQLLFEGREKVIVMSLL